MWLLYKNVPRGTFFPLYEKKRPIVFSRVFSLILTYFLQRSLCKMFHVEQYVYKKPFRNYSLVVFLIFLGKCVSFCKKIVPRGTIENDFMIKKEVFAVFLQINVPRGTIRTRKTIKMFHVEHFGFHFSFYAHHVGYIFCFYLGKRNLNH